MTEQEKKRMLNEIEMLRGNINRIAVSDSKEEIWSMYLHAFERLQEITRIKLRDL